jgi:hypothetical protein
VSEIDLEALADDIQRESIAKQKRPRRIHVEQEQAVSKVSTPCVYSPGVQKTQWYSKKRVDGKTRQAHRVAYESVHGPIPPGLVIDHLCRNPACINVEHMEAVSDRVNILRGTSPSAENARKTHCVRGHDLAGDNLRILSTTGERVCKACAVASGAAYRQKGSRAESPNPRITGRPPRLSRTDEWELYCYRKSGVAIKTCASMFRVSVPTANRIIAKFRDYNEHIEPIAREFRERIKSLRDST